MMKRRTRTTDAESRPRLPNALLLILAACLISTQALGQVPDDPDAPAHCPNFSSERRALFGDLHVHTSLSSDAYVFATRTRPDDAYRFASGRGSARMDVVTQLGLEQSSATIPRPLDFAAITDHAEMLGGPNVCTTPGNAGYESEVCQRFRAPWTAFASLEEGVARVVKLLGDLDSDAVCGEGGVRGERCVAGMATAWQEIQDSAARNNDPCDFTTFVAFEYSSNPEMSKAHRNVIFRNDVVPDLPVSSRITPTETGLWQTLERDCVDAGDGCDVLTIPHNPNLSNGRIFSLDYGGASTEGDQRAYARLRSSMEPLVEMFQIKGDSECRNGLPGVLGGPDELCGFEKYRAPDGAIPDSTDCADGVGGGALLGQGCMTRRDFARYAVARGLTEEERIGINPFKVGFIGSTDIHEGLPGDTDEWVRDGVLRPQRTNSFGADNPGGLAAVWAEENTREAIFEALDRREAFATSGPRIELRFYGGWDLPDDFCAAPDLAKRADAIAVPMGADLPSRGPTGTSRQTQAGPTFIASALADPGIAGHPGGLLERLQIIKVTSDDQGNAIQEIVDIAGRGADSGEAAALSPAGVDLRSCLPTGPGAASLCAQWSDPNFDPNERAAYYSRVVENPSCRAFTRACLQLKGEARPAACDDPAIRRLAQERAWSSPIWYTP